MAESESPRRVAIRATGLGRRFGSLRALHDVSFEVPSGVICGLIGPNGAGKTTLLRVLSGLDEPDEGTREMDGVDLAVDPHGARTRFGYVPDFAALYDGLTVAEVVAFFARAQGVPPNAVDACVADALQRTGLKDIADRPASALSKGMSQRACVACALVHDPAVLLLDEPASGLDPRARIELRDLIKSLRDAGKTILISSHILSELSDMVDRVLIIERGAVKASGEVNEALQVVQPRARLVVRVEVLGEVSRAVELLKVQAGVMEVRTTGSGLEMVLTSPSAEVSEPALTARMVKLLVEAGVEVTAVVPQRANLETLFMSVTRGEVQ